MSWLASTFKSNQCSSLLERCWAQQCSLARKTSSEPHRGAVSQWFLNFHSFATLREVIAHLELQGVRSPGAKVKCGSSGDVQPGENLHPNRCGLHFTSTFLHKCSLSFSACLVCGFAYVVCAQTDRTKCYVISLMSIKTLTLYVKMPRDGYVSFCLFS